MTIDCPLLHGGAIKSCATTTISMPYTRFTQLRICPRNTLRIHGRVLWPKPVTTDDFIINTGHCRRLYTRFTQLCVTPQNALKIHGRVLWHKPITTDGFIFVLHYYWGAGPTPTAVLCPPSGFQFRLHVGSRSNPIQSLNQYQINIWLYDTFLHNKIWYFVLSCLANTLSPLCNILQININPSRILHIYTREVHLPHI